MRTVIRQIRKAAGIVNMPMAALRSVPARLAALLPWRLRRAMGKIERAQLRPAGIYAILGTLAVTVAYGVVAGGHLNGVADKVLLKAGLGIEDVSIDGQSETSELAVLELLELDSTSSLLGYNIAEARNRIIGLPWIGSASLRKLYPDELIVTVNERKPFALWQRGNVIVLIDRTGRPIVEYSDSRFADLPLLVGYGAETVADGFVDQLKAYPSLSARVRASVYVSGRRWNLVLDNGVTVKLPERNTAAALDTLVRIDRTDGLLSRNVSEVDMRLADRIVVRIADETEADDTNIAISNKDRDDIRQIARAGGRT